MNNIILEAQANNALGHTLITLIAFILLLYFVGKFAWNPLMNVLSARQQAISSEVSEAEANNAAAKENREEAEKFLNEARHQATQIVEDAHQQGIRTQEELVEAARAEVARIHEEAKTAIAVKRQEAIKDLEGEISGVVVALAEQVAKRHINEEDHQRLVEEFIQGMDEL